MSKQFGKRDSSSPESPGLKIKCIDQEELDRDLQDKSAVFWACNVK